MNGHKAKELRILLKGNKEEPELKRRMYRRLKKKFTKGGLK